MDNLIRAVRELMRQRAEFQAACGDEVNQAIPLYEDPTRYPVEELVALFHIQQEMTEAETPEKRAEALKEVSTLSKELARLKQQGR